MGKKIRRFMNRGGYIGQPTQNLVQSTPISCLVFGGSRRMGGRRRSRRRSRRMMGGLFPSNQIMPYLPVQYHGSLGGRSRRMRMGGESLPLVETGWA